MFRIQKVKDNKKGALSRLQKLEKPIARIAKNAFVLWGCLHIRR
jgi:hypothetical protein